jgi:hypothetical protein
MRRRWGAFNDSNWSFSSHTIRYEKKNSISETITVTVETESQYNHYMDHLARRARDNTKDCSCDSCCNPRNRQLGNSRNVLSVNEARELMKSVQDYSQSLADTPNSKWRSRKFGKSTH